MNIIHKNLIDKMPEEHRDWVNVVVKRFIQRGYRLGLSDEQIEDYIGTGILINLNYINKGCNIDWGTKSLWRSSRSYSALGQLSSCDKWRKAKLDFAEGLIFKEMEFSREKEDFSLDISREEMERRFNYLFYENEEIGSHNDSKEWLELFVDGKVKIFLDPLAFAESKGIKLESVLKQYSKKGTKFKFVIAPEGSGLEGKVFWSKAALAKAMGWETSYDPYFYKIPFHYLSRQPY